MEKILVSIYVLSIDETYDLLLPINLKMTDALDLIQNSIAELSSNNYVKHEDVILLNSESFAINTNNVVRLSGLTNGCRVVLI
jgi:hypothetical protein